MLFSCKGFDSFVSTEAVQLLSGSVYQSALVEGANVYLIYITF